MISEEAVSRVLAGTDIVQLIGRYLTLKPAGRYYKALCPFHKRQGELVMPQFKSGRLGGKVKVVFAPATE